MTEPFGSAEELDELERLCDAAITSRCPVCDDDTGDPPDYCNCGEAQERFEGTAGPATVKRLIGEVRRLSTKLVVAHVDIERLKHENASLKAELARVVLATEGK